MNINNKEKQAAAGNWGSDKYTKEHTNVKVPEDVEEVPYFKSKKGKKTKGKKVPYIYPGHQCPFCKKELPDDQEKIAQRKNASKGSYWPLHIKVDTCPACHATCKDTECPACKHDTWVKDGWYKHQSWGCGFEGRRKC